MAAGKQQQADALMESAIAECAACGCSLEGGASLFEQTGGDRVWLCEAHARRVRERWLAGAPIRDAIAGVLVECAREGRSQ